MQLAAAIAPVPAVVGDASEFALRPAGIAGPMSLLALRPVAGRCEWSVLEPPNFTRRRFMVSFACPPMPLGFAWDAKSSRSVFSLDAQLYVHDWKSGRIDALGPAPREGQENPEVGFSERGTPHVCQELRRAKPGATDGVEYSYKVNLERDASGSWKEVAAELIDYEMVNRRLCSGGDYYWDPGGVWYEPQEQTRMNCRREMASRDSKEVCPSLAVIDFIGKQVQLPHDGFFEYLFLGPSRWLAYAGLQSDSGVTRLQPLFYIENERATVIHKRGPKRAMLLAQAGDYLLVREEGSIARATLLRKGEAQPQPLIRFEDETVVMWIPGSILPGELIQIPRPGAG